MSAAFCTTCGQLHTKAVTEGLWDIYYRLPGGHQYIEPLVYIPGEDFDPYDEDDFDAAMVAMERNMYERGLCTECGRPNLQGVDPETVLPEEDAQDLADMYAEMAAERRMGA